MITTVRIPAVMNKPMIRALEMESAVLLTWAGSAEEGFADSEDNAGAFVDSAENRGEGSGVSEDSGLAGSGVTGIGLGSSGTGVGSGSGSGVSGGREDGSEEVDGSGVSSVGEIEGRSIFIKASSPASTVPYAIPNFAMEKSSLTPFT